MGWVGARVGDAATWQRNSMLSALVWLALLQHDAHTPMQQCRRQAIHQILHRRRLRRWVGRGRVCNQQSCIATAYLRSPCSRPSQPSHFSQPSQLSQVPGGRCQMLRGRGFAGGKRPTAHRGGPGSCRHICTAVLDEPFLCLVGITVGICHPDGAD
jgi:hypothetical protein